MNIEKISPIIHNLLKTTHISRCIKEDLFQDLYLYHIQLEKRYNSELNVPLEAFLIKFLKWRMWALIKNVYQHTTEIMDNIQDYREEPAEDSTALLKELNNVLEEDKTLLILRHCLGKSYQELTKFTGLSIEGVRKKLKKIEDRIKWESLGKKKGKKEK